MKWWSEMDGARTEPDRIDARADWSTVAGPDRLKSAVRCYFDGPLTFIVVSLLLIAVAIAACCFPARRAMKIEPVVALRQE